MKVDQYEIIRSLGKGGMGEVFLVKDPLCAREVALKKIRDEMNGNKTMQERFLREAKVAALLTHPSIIPIYAISKENLYYTMPHVEGETLKQIVRQTREEEKNGEAVHPIGSSIPTLIRIFLSVCQAIAYSHSRGILHRDLKPENIIVGKYGEVMLLDWGLADFIAFPSEEVAIDIPESHDLTRPGKIPGTLSYLPPERVRGEPSSIHTDIYALGVILYQLLTLELPFHRPTIEAFRKMMKHERLLDPIEVAPYRDIPPHLADITKKCLHIDKNQRYQSVDSLISDLESYVEGKPEWMPAASLNIAQKEDWEFQENVLLAKHIAITRGTEVMEWVNLMISKASFSGNTQVKTRIKLNKASHGVGFLLGIPESAERKGLEDGYCLWIGQTCKLFRSNVEVLSNPDVHIPENTWHTITIEKVEHHLRFFLDGELRLHYISHIPLTGTHLGVLLRDVDFQIEEIQVFTGSQNVTVNCLAVPDAFLAAKYYTKALLEYRRIGYSFAGRAEGREALFRAGITLLEEALSKKKTPEREQLLIAALDEFSKLRNTPGAPLEYLGKSLVYKASNELEEEVKCLELALRKYPKHPLLSVLSEHIALRLHETSFHNRVAAYQFALLALRHLPQIFANPDHRKLFESLESHWETLAFIERADHEHNTSMAIILAFWLVKPITLVEILESTKSTLLIGNALFALLELGFDEWVKENLHHLNGDPMRKAEIESALNGIQPTSQRAKLYIVQKKHNLPALTDALPIAQLLLNNSWKEAGEKLSPPFTANEHDPIFFLTGCWLRKTQGEKAALSYFSNLLDAPFPPINSLLANYLHRKIDLKKGHWAQQSFLWEKMELCKQLLLYYHCAGKSKEAQTIRNFLTREKKRVYAAYSYP